MQVKFRHWIDVTAFLLIAAYAISHPAPMAHYVVGMAMAAGAFPVWMLARYQLGHSFSVRARATTLVTTGLYSRIRHPIYVFGGIAFVGIFLALSWVLGSVAAVVQLLQLTRIHEEEAVLEQAFGARVSPV